MFNASGDKSRIPDEKLRSRLGSASPEETRSAEGRNQKKQDTDGRFFCSFMIPHSAFIISSLGFSSLIYFLTNQALRLKFCGPLIVATRAVSSLTFGERQADGLTRERLD